MSNYLISDEQLQLIEGAGGVEILRSGHKSPYQLIIQKDGRYIREYETDEMITEGEEIQVHFYGYCDEYPWPIKSQSFILRSVGD